MDEEKTKLRTRYELEKAKLREKLQEAQNKKVAMEKEVS